MTDRPSTVEIAPPRVSVIVPAYGVADVLGQTLASLQAQTLESWEAVVIDDGTPDDVAAAFAPFAHDARFRLLRTDNRGPSTARNRGLAVARAPYVALLDGDDLYEPLYLETMLAAIEADPSLGFVSCDQILFGPSEPGERLYSSRYPLDGEVTLARVVSRDVRICITTIMRRAALEAVGGFDPALRGVEDLDLWIRLLAAGWAGAIVRQPLARYRRHAGSLSAQSRNMLVNTCALYRKTAAALEGRPEQAAALRVLGDCEDQLRWLDGQELIRAGRADRGLRLLAGAERRSLRWRLALTIMRAAPWTAAPLLRLRG